MAETIKPRILKGFRDSLPQQEFQRERLLGMIQEQFRLFGFVGIDTPVLEYSEILLGKGSGETDKQLYAFQDNGGRDVAMRFDLTVPLARFIVQNKDKLHFPLKRYHIAKVWRGENTQKGRYREFFQCDFDIVGSDSFYSDGEVLLLVYEIFSALGLPDSVIEINHRALLGFLLESLGLNQENTGETLLVSILRLIDKSEKIGEKAFEDGLNALVPNTEVAKIILKCLEPKETAFETLSVFESYCKNIDGSQAVIDYMRQLFEWFSAFGLSDRIQLNPKITRGLDYYTGLVFETFVTDFRSYGSICSGGRYNNLTQLFHKEKIPGIGGSVGLDRLLALLEERGNSVSFHAADILFFHSEDDFSIKNEVVKLSMALRKIGKKVLVFPEKKKMTAQFKFADANGIPYGIIYEGENTWTVKEFSTRKNYNLLNEKSILDFFQN